LLTKASFSTLTAAFSTPEAASGALI